MIAGIFFIALLGLDVLMGYCGQVSLGHAAFMATGGYSAAICCVKYRIYRRSSAWLRDSSSRSICATVRLARHGKVCAGITWRSRRSRSVLLIDTLTVGL